MKRYREVLFKKGPLFLYNKNMSKNKNEKYQDIGCLYGLIMIGLIILLGFVCAKAYPLWVITLVLILNVLWLIFLILFDIPRNQNIKLLKSKEYIKNRKKLLFWSFLCAFLFWGTILLLIFFDIPLSSSAGTIALFIGIVIGSKFANHKF